MTDINEAAKVDLAELRKLAEAATQGPWEARHETDDNCNFAGFTIHAANGKTISDDGTGPFPDDAQFIAAANPAVVLALLDTIASQQEQSRRTGYGEGVRRAAQLLEDRDLPVLAELIRNLQATRLPTSQEKADAIASQRQVIAGQVARVANLESTLRKVANWELPPTGKFWGDGTPTSYGAEYGSNGVRDYFRNLAHMALKSAAAPVAPHPESQA